jgi:hypothetical protein
MRTGAGMDMRAASCVLLLSRISLTRDIGTIAKGAGRLLRRGNGARSSAWKSGRRAAVVKTQGLACPPWSERRQKASGRGRGRGQHCQDWRQRESYRDV